MGIGGEREGEGETDTKRERETRYTHLNKKNQNALHSLLFDLLYRRVDGARALSLLVPFFIASSLYSFKSRPSLFSPHFQKAGGRINKDIPQTHNSLWLRELRRAEALVIFVPPLHDYCLVFGDCARALHELGIFPLSFVGCLLRLQYTI